MWRLSTFGGCFGARRRVLFLDGKTVPGNREPAIPADMDQMAKRKILDIWDRTRMEIDSKTAGMIRVSAVDTVVGMLDRGSNWVTITGNAGDGKTTLGLLVLKQLREHVSAYCIEKPKEYRHLTKFTEDRVIMFDDRFGAFTSDHALINKWNNVISDILHDFDRNDTQTKVIFISRRNVVNEARDYLGHSQNKILDPENIFDLSLVKIQGERLQILNHYLKQGKLEVDSEVKSRVAGLNIAHGFPHCSMMYPKLRAKKQDLNIEEFFMTPLKFLNITTTILYNENCGDLFELMIKNDGKFDANSLADKARRKSLLQVEREQDGSYITVWKNGVCEFAHPSIYESVLNVICRKDALLCVQHASLSVIRQKLNLTSEETPTQISVRPVKLVLRALAERFRPEVLQGDYSVFSHRFCDNKDFCEELLDICVTSDGAAPQQSSRNGSDEDEDEARGGSDVGALQQNSREGSVDDEDEASSGSEDDEDQASGGSDDDEDQASGGSDDDEDQATGGSDDDEDEASGGSDDDEDQAIGGSDDDEDQASGGSENDEDEASGPVAVSSVTVQDTSQLPSTTAVSDSETLAHQICQHLAERGVISHTQLQLDSTSETTRPSRCADPDTFAHQIMNHLAATPERGIVSHTQLHLESILETTGPSRCAVFQQVNVNVTQQQFGDVSVKADTIRNVSLGCQHHIYQAPAAQQKGGEKQQDGSQGVRDVSESSTVMSEQPIDRPGKDDRTMLWTAVYGVRKPMLHALIEHGADVNIPDGSGNTLLPYLCRQDEVDNEGVKLAIRKGADYNVIDETGNTLLLLNCKQNIIDDELVKVLVEKGDSIFTNTKDRYGMTAVHYLCGRKRVDNKLVRFILTKGRGDINLPDDIGATPLHWLSGNTSCSVGDIKQLTVEGQGNMNIQDDFGFTPLHYLCAKIEDKDERDKKSLLTLIQEVGGDVNLSDHQGSTPLHYISMTKNQSAAYLLKNIPGADWDILNDAGISPRDYMLGLANTSDLMVAPPLNRTSEDLVIKVRNSKGRWIPVLGRAMILNSERVHRQLQVEGRELNNMVSSKSRETSNQFKKFWGTCSGPFPLPPSPSPISSPSYWETLSILRWRNTLYSTVLEMGVVQGERDIEKVYNVSSLPGGICVSVRNYCHDHLNRLCVQVRRGDLECSWDGQQVGKCASLPLPTSGEEVTFTFGLVLDVGRGRVAFIDVERKRLLGKINMKFSLEVYPMFYVDPDNDLHPTRMRLISGREISVTEEKIKLIQQALSD